MGKPLGNVSVKFRLKPGVERVMELKFLAALARGGQLVVADAARNHPYQDDSGNNTRSIGLAISGKGKSSFGPVQTQGNGPVGSQGVNDKPDNLTVAVATTSGYGGYLEVGTERARQFPYILPAFEKNKQAIKQELTGIY